MADFAISDSTDIIGLKCAPGFSSWGTLSFILPEDTKFYSSLIILLLLARVMVLYKYINILFSSFFMMNIIRSAVKLILRNNFFSSTIDILGNNLNITQILHAYVWFHFWESVSGCRKLQTAEPRHLEIQKTKILTEAHHVKRSSTHHIWW